MNRQYKNPPIREVVCEFRFAEDGRWDGAAPGLIYSSLSDEFPRRLVDEVQQPPSVPSVESPNLLPPALQQLGVGLRLVPGGPLKFWKDGDETGYIAVAPYRLSVHHFRPYPSWARFSEIICKGVGAYQEVLEPAKIQRIGVRYINDIVLGQMSASLEEFFDYFPFVGLQLPQSLARFHCMVQINFENDRDMLTLQIATGPQTEEGEAQIILDLDYFLAQPDGFEMDESVRWLEQAHANLENVFEGCLKESARDLFR